MAARLFRFIRPILLLAAFASFAVLLGARDGSPASAQTPPGEDNEALRELAQRLLMPPYRGPGQVVSSIELLPAALPAAMPADIPLPEGGRLVGSAVRSAGAIRNGIDVVADVAQAPGKVAEYYRQQFTAAGWTSPYYGGPGPRGFQPTAVQLQQSFCKSGVGFANVSAFGVDDASTDLRLNFQLETPPGATGGAMVPPSKMGCGPTPAIAPVPPRFPPGYELLPSLFAPEGVTVEVTGGGGGGPNMWTSEATAKTDMSAVALEAHFAKQLESAGWKRIAGGAAGPMTSSSWTVAGEGGPWQGLLFVLDGPGEKQRVLHVRVFSAQTSYGGGYGIAYPPPPPYAVPATATPAPIPPPKPAAP